MSETRIIKGIKVESCEDCPNSFHDYGIICGETGKQSEVANQLFESCPLLAWPSISHAQLRKRAIQLYEDSNLGQMHILHVLEELMKEINVEIVEGKDVE